MPATILVTSLADAGPGTLRAAIIQAGEDKSPDTITFAPAVTGTIALTTALPDLTTVTIVGPGSGSLTVARNTASETPAFGIFTVPAGAEVTISGLTISGGRADYPAWGGGISNAGALTVTNSTISDNSAGFGGGIFSNDSGSSLTIIDSTISGNSAVEGGGISTAGVATVTGTTITGNTSSDAGGGGGGIYNGGTLTLTNSTLSGNSAVGHVNGVSGIGGGILNAGTLTLTNSTLSGNSAFANTIQSGLGGGIYNFGTLTLTNSTLSGNSAFANTIQPGEGGGIFTGSAVRSLNSIFNNAVGGNVQFSGTDARFQSLGHNLFSDTPAVTLDPTDLTMADPLLGPLADNGGPTFTQSLLAGSPAIDSGAAVPGVTTDQRGVSRPQGAAADIGAFEAVGVPGATPPTITGLRRLGVHRRPTTLVLTFSAAMASAFVQDVRNYTLVLTGHAGRVAPHARPIPVGSAVYDPMAQTVALTPRRRLALHGYYRLTVNGTPPAGLRGTGGVYLDGSGVGQPGSDYVALVHRFATVVPKATAGVASAVPTGPLEVTCR